MVGKILSDGFTIPFILFRQPTRTEALALPATPPSSIPSSKSPAAPSITNSLHPAAAEDDGLTPNPTARRSFQQPPQHQR